MQQCLDELIDRWKAEGLRLVPAASVDEVRETFEALGSSATPDVIALYTALGGMHEMANEYWRLWSLEEIDARNTERSSPFNEPT